jgi:hypothetical protein
MSYKTIILQSRIREIVKEVESLGYHAHHAFHIATQTEIARLQEIMDEDDTNTLIEKGRSLKLAEFKEITNIEYLILDSPIFVVQTIANKEGVYWMCWMTKTGDPVKTHERLYPIMKKEPSWGL